ncbi:MAG: hypothetical protein WC769_04515 [Thermodesulfovibrionales bacterium]|jgi:hypothetical protein
MAKINLFFDTIVNLLRSLFKKLHTLTLALSPQGRGYLRIAPPLRGGDKGEGVKMWLYL